MTIVALSFCAALTVLSAATVPSAITNEMPLPLPSLSLSLSAARTMLSRAVALGRSVLPRLL